jgi:hypothetical protein
MVFEKPFYIPVVGKPDSFAILNTPECYDGYMGFIPKGTVWDNKITPGGLLWPYRPIRVVRKISCPVLIVCAKNDSLASERVIRRTANRVKKCELIIRPINHFEIYSGKPFEEIIRIEAEFLCRSLL